MQLIESILADAAAITAIHHDIHAHPELCFEEKRTTDVIAKALTDWGIPIHHGLGTTGVVGIVKGTRGDSTRAVGLRADIDALPINEHNGPSPRETAGGACTPAATTPTPPCCWRRPSACSKNRDFDGTVYLIFQPAEEGGGGAREIIRTASSRCSRWRRCSARTTGRAWRWASSR